MLARSFAFCLAGLHRLVLFVILGGIAVFAPLSEAQETLGSARALVDQAAMRNPEIKAEELDVQALRSSTEQAGRWDDPMLEVGAERKTEPFGHTGFGRFGISQNIPRPGRLDARAEVARSAEKLGEFEQAQAGIELRGRVLERIYAYRVAREKAAHAQERVDRFQLVEGYLKSRPFAAPQKRAEAAIVRSKLLVLRKELRELESSRIIAWNGLNLYLGLGRETEVAAPWYKKPPAFSLEALGPRAERQNPSLRRQTLRFELRENEVHSARLESWAGVTLSAGYANGTGASPEKNYGLGLAFPLPLLNGNRGALAAAEAARSAEESRLAWAREKLTAELKSTLEHYRAAAATVAELSPDRIPAQEREMKEIDAGFRRGQVDLITYLEADSQHTESLNAILEAQTNYLSALREVLLLVGEAPQPLE